MSNTTTFGNVTIHTIDHVLGFPGSLAETVALDNTSLALLAPLLRRAEHAQLEQPQAAEVEGEEAGEHGEGDPPRQARGPQPP